MTALASAHGGHSGEFCCHAEDDLADIVQAYVDRGFAWAGITEHMPPPSDEFVYPDESELGFDAAALNERFTRYIATCKKLQTQHADAIDLYVGFESEWYTGAFEFAQKLIAQFQPDYIVGSVHTVDDRPIDYTREHYAELAAHFGGTAALYCRYFDQQLEMIDALRPAVVGHFDLIRIYDDDYHTTLQDAEVQRRIRRNLERIAELDLILDFNLAALDKGADEPYVSAPILDQARELGIALVPGDDSHGVATVGRRLEEGIRILQERGFDTDWRRPVT